MPDGLRITRYSKKARYVKSVSVQESAGNFVIVVFIGVIPKARVVVIVVVVVAVVVFVVVFVVVVVDFDFDFDFS